MLDTTSPSSKWKTLKKKFRNVQWEKPMSRPQRFEIHFDHPDAAYFSDEIVTGKVLLEISEPLNLKGVKMRFKGECSIQFSETKKILTGTKKSPTPRKQRKSGQKTAPHDAAHGNGRDHNEMKDYSKKEHFGNGFPYSNGVDNPGYIPEMYDELRRPSEGLLQDPFSASCPAPKYRPRSVQSVSSEPGILNGARQFFQAIETYFDCEFYIYGHKYQKDEKEMLPAGLHDFPFAFNLPPNLPPSFSSDRGIIRYIVAAVLDRPAAANLVRKAGFTLVTIRDLNVNPLAGSNTSRSRSVNPCGLCCDTGPITLSLRLPRQGYVPGESICVSAEVDNISGKQTKRTKLTLSQVLTFTMPNNVKTHQEERILRQSVRGTLAPGDSDFWEDVALQVPPIPPNNIHKNCRLLNLDYKLEMVVELQRPWKDLKVSVPILIGNVPLRSTFASLVPPVPPEDPKDAAPPLPGHKYQDFPLYTFRKCFFGDEILEHQYERLTGDAEYMGPPFVAETPFCPNYLTYTPRCDAAAESRSSSPSDFDVESTVTR